jgi:uncharacterized protein YndB with AHSA1/START domain
MTQAPSTSFDLTSHWRIPSPVGDVWDALIHPLAWPDWWPYVREVRLQHEGGKDGLGSIHFIRWATRLPYEIAFEVETVEVKHRKKLRGLARGELEGQGTWTLEPDSKTATNVTYLWQVNLGKAWMRASAPLLAPVFRWNHNGLMASGEAGLIEHLAGKE